MDLDILVFLQNIRQLMGSYGLLFFELLSSSILLGSYALIGVIALLKGERKKGYRIVLTFILAECCAQLLKNTFCIPRPFRRTDLLFPSETALKSAAGFSFPSGHTTAAGSLLLSIRSQYGEGHPVRRVLCLIMIGMTALSRLMLSVHTPQDVLGGFCIAFIMHWVSGKIIEAIEAKKITPEHVLMYSSIAGVMMMLYVMNKPYPLQMDDASMDDALRICGGILGMGWGWYAEQQYHLYRKYERKEWWSQYLLTGLFFVLFCAMIIQIPCPQVFEEFKLFTAVVFCGLFAAPYYSYTVRRIWKGRKEEECQKNEI